MAVGVAVMAIWSLLPGVAHACFEPPVPGPVAVGYQQPACEYCRGHRGLEFHPPAGVAVHAVVGGVVTFSGSVAGTSYVVVGQPDGSRWTYGMLSTRTVSVGALVAAGQVIGQSSARLYFGLRDADDRPIDPTAMLGRWVGRPRLIPTDGARPRAAPPPRLTCSD